MNGQRRKEGEEEKGRENEGICPFEDERVYPMTVKSLTLSGVKG